MYSKETVSQEQKEFLQKIRNRKRMIHLVQLFLLIFFFLLWEVAAQKRMDRSIYIQSAIQTDGSCQRNDL